MHTVFFDIDDTLIDHRGAENKALLSIKHEYFPSDNQMVFEETWAQITKKNWDLFTAKKLSFTEQRNNRIIEIWRAYDKQVSTSEAESIFLEYLSFYEMHWNVFPDALVLLEQLKSQSIPLGIITNGNPDQQYKKLSQVGILNFFEPKLIIISEQVGVAKPDPEIFSIAQKAAGVSAEHLYFIGDNYDSDIGPAMKLNWNAYHIDRGMKTSTQQSLRSLSEFELK